MKQDDYFNKDKYVSKVFNSALENQSSQVEQMQTALQKTVEAKKLIMLMMDNFKDGKMDGDKYCEKVRLKMDEADCRLMETIIALSEAVDIS